MSRNVHHYLWTPEMDATLKKLYGHWSSREIAQIINDEYGTGYSKSAIDNRITVKQLSTKEPGHSYTKEEDEWLCQNLLKYTYKDLVVAFNQTFHTSIGYYALKSHCIGKGFKGGTSVDKGYKNWRFAPIGTESIYNGRIYVKVSDAPASRMAKNHMANWTEKGRLVWEQHHGKIPEGYVIVYLDGNPLNCDISNLECTTNSINGQLSVPCKGTSADLKRCAIKMKTLEKILEGVEKMSIAKIGSKIRIIEMYGEPQYTGKEGIVTHIDDAGQLHGTWGVCAIIPETDSYEVLEGEDTE